MLAIETERLRLREAGPPDAAFIAGLMNEPDYLRIVGDWGVRSADDAGAYIGSAAIYAYGREGLGFNIVELRNGGARVGICGLVRREAIGDVELGYAVRADHRGAGYATEAARATLEHAHTGLGLRHVVGIVDAAHAASRRVLEKIGMRLDLVCTLPGDREKKCIYLSLAPDAVVEKVRPIGSSLRAVVARV